MAIVNKIIFWCSISLLLLMPSNVIMANTEETVIISYNDTYNESGNQNIRIPMLSKNQRLNRYASHFDYGMINVDEKTRKCIDYCLNIWESCILGGDTIRIDFKFNNSESDIKTDVRYVLSSGCYIPSALYYSKLSSRATEIKDVDGIISINPSIDWDYSIGENVSDNKINLTSALIRAIARILGFGSSVGMNSSGQYFFSCKRGYTIFDNLISRSDTKKLTSIPTNGGKINTELKKFIDNPNFHFIFEAKKNNYRFIASPYTTYCISIYNRKFTINIYNR